MIDVFLAAVLASGSTVVSTACPAVEEFRNDHLLDVCDPILEGGKVYSVSYQASLTPPPAAQQVALYELDGQWFIWVAGYEWERGTSLVTTRRNDIAISKDDAKSLILFFDDARLERLSQASYYGDPLVLCTDGARTEIVIASEGMTRSFARHSCAGKSELNEIAAAFRKMALKYDAGFEGLLTGLRN